MIKTPYKCTLKNFSSVTSLDKDIQSFIENEGKESFARQCTELEKTPTLQVISNILKSTRGEAGILVPICSVHRRPSLLFTVRARHLNSHAGEIRFASTGFHFSSLNKVKENEERKACNSFVSSVFSVPHYYTENIWYQISWVFVNKS